MTGDDLIAEDKIDRAEKKTCRNDHDYGIADTLLCLADTLHAKTQAHKGAAAVTDHDRDRKGNNCQGEHDRVGRVTVGAKISRICDEDLIHDVVQCSDEQGDDAGDGVFAHECSDLLLPEKLI